MSAYESIVRFCDVTGASLYFSLVQIDALVKSPEHKRFSSVIANTIKHPHEIWCNWEKDVQENGKWNHARYYLQLLDLSETDINQQAGLVIVRFIYHTRWELNDVFLYFGDHKNIMLRTEQFRIGDIAYSNSRH